MRPLRHNVHHIDCRPSLQGGVAGMNKEPRAYEATKGVPAILASRSNAYKALMINQNGPKCNRSTSPEPLRPRIRQVWVRSWGQWRILRGCAEVIRGL